MRPAWSLVLALTLFAASAHARGGGPTPGLTDAELAAFKVGFEAFRTLIFEEQGLGPGFNGVQCYSCHRNPALGGQSNKFVTRFARNDGSGFDPLDARGGTLLQSKALNAGCLETVPAEANIVIRRNVSSILGDGFIEAIPDQQIIARAAAEQAANPTMAGRVNMVTGVSDGLSHVGRFGWKAQRALLVDAVGEALV